MLTQDKQGWQGVFSSGTVSQVNPSELEAAAILARRVVLRRLCVVGISLSSVVGSLFVVVLWHGVSPWYSAAGAVLLLLVAVVVWPRDWRLWLVAAGSYSLFAFLASRLKALPPFLVLV